MVQVKMDTDDIIRYKGRIYRVPRGVISKLVLDPENLDAIAKKVHAEQYGGHLVWEQECEVCPYGVKVSSYVLGEYTICKYANYGVEWAAKFNNGGGDFMARKRPCLIDDTQISVLVEKGELGRYEVRTAPRHTNVYPPSQEDEMRRKFKEILDNAPPFLRELISV